MPKTQTLKARLKSPAESSNSKSPKVYKDPQSSIDLAVSTRQANKKMIHYDDLSNISDDESQHSKNSFTRKLT